MTMAKPVRQLTDTADIPAGPAWLRAVEVGVALAVAVLAVGTIWGEPRPIGDLYAGLAVGRDVMDGKLGQPDDWSFMTHGKVAVNQNWGSHFLHYLVYQATGPIGLLVLKAAIIGGMALFASLAARQRKVGWPVALLVAAGAVAAGRSYIDLRANLTTLMIAPLALWLMMLSRHNVHWMWAVMVLNGVWANVHGGFIFGLGMTGLWAGVLLVERTIEILRVQRPALAALKTAARRLWPLPVTVLGSVALAAYVNPYGPTNLTFPFQILDPCWQELNEWQPLLSQARFGTTWEFFTVAGVLGGLLVVRVAGIPGVPSSYLRWPNLRQGSMALFDLALTAVVFGMTFKARRFVPLSVIVVAPFLAIQVQWLVSLLTRADRYLGSVAVGVIAAALTVPLALHAEKLVRLYNPNNPRRGHETLFERMNGTWFQPTEAAKFLAANGITGRCFNEWRWEGYLRWKCPGIQVYMGGRAHQVYDGAVDMLARRIRADARKFPDPRYGVNPTKDLADLGVHLVAVPRDSPRDLEPRHGGMLWHLMERPGATWAYIYMDVKGIYMGDIVAADTAFPETAELVRRAIAGDLKYPDEASATLSRAMAMTAASMRIPAAETLEAFLTAVEVRPSSIAYDAIRQLAKAVPNAEEWQKAYFLQEYSRVEAMDYHQAEGHEILAMRIHLAEHLATLYRKEGNAEQATRWTRARDQAVATLNAVLEKWP